MKVTNVKHSQKHGYIIASKGEDYIILNLKNTTMRTKVRRSLSGITVKVIFASAAEMPDGTLCTKSRVNSQKITKEQLDEFLTDFTYLPEDEKKKLKTKLERYLIDPMITTLLYHLNKE